MSRALYTNLASGTLSAGIGGAATSLTLNAGQGSLFPSPTNGDYVWISITDAATKTNVEIVKCTARAGDVLTIIRGQQGTSALSWLANDVVELRITATGMAELWQNALHGSQFFSTSGSFTCPSGVYSVNVTVCGGSGGGGGATINTTSGIGGGGGAGALGKALAVSVSPFSVYSVIVGTGGTGGVCYYSPSSGAGGANGGTSSFTTGVVVSASGGFGGGGANSGGVNGVPGNGGRTITNCNIVWAGADGNASNGDGGYGQGSTMGTSGANIVHSNGEGYAGGGGCSYGDASGVGGTGANGYVLVEW